MATSVTATAIRVATPLRFKNNERYYSFLLMAHKISQGHRIIERYDMDIDLDIHHRQRGLRDLVSSFPNEFISHWSLRHDLTSQECKSFVEDQARGSCPVTTTPQKLQTLSHHGTSPQPDYKPVRRKDTSIPCHEPCVLQLLTCNTMSLPRSRACRPSGCKGPKSKKRQTRD